MRLHDALYKNWTVISNLKLLSRCYLFLNLANITADRFEILVFLLSRRDIVKRFFVNFSRLSDILYWSLEGFPLDTRGKQDVLSKNVVAFFAQETQLSPDVCSKD